MVKLNQGVGKPVYILGQLCHGPWACSVVLDDPSERQALRREDGLMLHHQAERRACTWLGRDGTGVGEAVGGGSADLPARWWQTSLGVYVCGGTSARFLRQMLSSSFSCCGVRPHSLTHSLSPGHITCEQSRDLHTDLPFVSPEGLLLFIATHRA